MIREKTWWELYKHFACCFEKIPEAAPYKTAVSPSISKSINEWWEKDTGYYLRSKEELISNILLWTPTYGHMSVGQPTKTYIHQFCTDTWCHLEDLPDVMADRDRWQKKKFKESVLTARHNNYEVTFSETIEKITTIKMMTFVQINRSIVRIISHFTNPNKSFCLFDR